MKLLTLTQAVAEIRHTVEVKSARGAKSPYFVLFGSGLSSPPLPTASGIIEHCREKALQDDSTENLASIESADPGSRYSYWFERAYPNPDERRDYLREQISKGYISAANFRLAHLFLEGRLARIAVTPNFDDYFARALRVFGKFPLVCDHPQTTERVRLDSEELQVIHIHGTYWYYDCCNLSSEILSRATPAPESSTSMASILDVILRDHSPIVLGYSGWETDVFMSALKRRLTRGLSYNMHWFCFRRESALKLPKWLVDRPDVRIVAPDEDQSLGSALGSSRAGPDRGTLPSTQVLDALVKALRPMEPELTTNPLKFLADQLERELTGDGGESLADDRYSIRSVVTRIRGSAPDRSLTAGPQLLLERVREAIRRADHLETIKLADQVNWLDVSTPDLIQMQSALYAAARGLNDGSETELRGCQLATSIGELLLAAGQLTEDAEILDAKSRHRMGFVLGVLNRHSEEIAAYEEIIARFGKSAVPALREQCAKAIFNRAFTLGELNRHDEEIAAYDEVIARCGGSVLPALQEQTAKASINKGFRLGQLNRHEEAITIYDGVLGQFQTSTAPSLQEPIANAMFNKGVSLGALKRNEEAIEVFQALIERFETSSVPAIQEHTATAIFNKAFRLGELTRNEEAIAVYSEFLGQYKSSSNPIMQELVASAMFNRAVMLEALGQRNAAIESYSEVVTMFYSASNSASSNLARVAHDRITKLNDTKLNDIPI